VWWKEREIVREENFTRAITTTGNRKKSGERREKGKEIDKKGTKKSEGKRERQKRRKKKKKEKLADTRTVDLVPDHLSCVLPPPFLIFIPSLVRHLALTRARGGVEMKASDFKQ
jgi:hypothetical protein